MSYSKATRVSAFIPRNSASGLEYEIPKKNMKFQEYEIPQYLFKWVTLFGILLMKIIHTFCVVKQLQL